VTADSSTCTFAGGRGTRLHARLERPSEGAAIRATAVFAHCFTCSKDLKVERRITAALTARGIAVLSFDFAGLGRSEGEFADSTYSADVGDLVAAAGYLAETIAPPTLMVGHSLGGAAVLSAALELPGVAAVATIGAPSDPGHVAHLLSGDLDRIRAEGEATVTIAGRSFTVGAGFLEDLEGQRLLERIARLEAALIFFHSPQDATVDVENARRLYEAARHPKSFVSLDGADHLLTAERDARYVAGVIAAWAERYLPAEGAVPAQETTAGDDAYGDATAVARNRGGFATDVEVRGTTLRVDEPADAGGTETGPTPYDHLTAALAACTSMTLRVVAGRRGIALDEVVTSVTHDRVHARDCAECEHHEGRIDQFTRRIRMTGDLSADDRALLLQMADRCPVHRTLEGQIEVRTRLER
jgi:putative redox protein